jgi:hypothetical protein
VKSFVKTHESVGLTRDRRVNERVKGRVVFRAGDDPQSNERAAFAKSHWAGDDPCKERAAAGQEENPSIECAIYGRCKHHLKCSVTKILCQRDVVFRWSM